MLSMALGWAVVLRPERGSYHALLSFSSVCVRRVQEVEFDMAKTRLRLGDAASESERFADALEEYKFALVGFTKVLAPHDR